MLMDVRCLRVRSQAQRSAARMAQEGPGPPLRPAGPQARSGAVAGGTFRQGSRPVGAPTYPAGQCANQTVSSGKVGLMGMSEEIGA
jgi:hypothetical protein